MRYIYNKMDADDDLRNFAKEYAMKPLNANGNLLVNDFTQRFVEGPMGSEYKGSNLIFDSSIQGVSAYSTSGQLQTQQYYNPNAQMQQIMHQSLGVNNASSMSVNASQSNSMEQVYAQMGQQIIQNNWFANNGYGLDTYNFVYQIEAKDGQFVLFYGENVVKYLQRITTRREQNNLKGGLSHTSKIKDKPIEICDQIFFKFVNRFQREDKPGKHYFNIFSSLNGHNDLLFDHKVVELSDINSSKFSLILKGEIVKPGQEALCSMFFRSETNRLAKLNVEIKIPLYPGWYKDDRYGWVYLNRCIYKNLENHEIPDGMTRRYVGRTERSVNDVYADIKPLIDNNWQNKLLFALRLVSPLLIMLEKQGIMPKQIIAPIVANSEQNTVATAILKTSDLFSLDTVSFDQYIGGIIKEIAAACDGVAVISGPQTAAEAKINGKQVRTIRNAAIGANGTDKEMRRLIAMIGRFLPVDISPEHVLPIDCTGLSTNIGIDKLRNSILEFDAAFIQYIEKNFEKVEGSVSNFLSKYRQYPDSGIIKERENLYIMVLAVQSVMKEYFGIELFEETSFVNIRKLFIEDSIGDITPDESVRDEFIDTASELIMKGEFGFMDVNKAHRQFNKGENILIVDKKKGFLSFEMSSLEKISERMNSVKNGAELAAILKQCNAMKCCDNGGRQITTPMGRTEFYSVYLSEFDDDVMNAIILSENFKFFILPEEAPEGFVPVVWYKGRCAGIVLGGEGLPNFHVNINGMSGLGKNRGAFRIAESCLKLGTKIIFIDVKGGCSDNQLINMDCDLHQYQGLDLKTEGLPFNIFNVKAFCRKNAKAGYIMNIFTSAVKLTSNQTDDLSSYVFSMIDDKTEVFSLDDLKAKISKNRKTSLEKKLTPFCNLMASYKPDKEEYQYNSCREFLDSHDRITILSLAQASTPEIRCVVYALMSSMYANQICDSSVPIVLVADEMQHYEFDSPFRRWVSEGRQYGISVWGVTQEYLSKDNDTRKFMSNASFNIFYGATTDSSKRVTEALNNRYTIGEIQDKGIGDIISKGYFWDPIEERHKPVIIEGRNDNN